MDHTRLQIWLRDKRLRTTPRMSVIATVKALNVAGQTTFTQSVECESGYRVVLYEAVSSLD